MQLFEITLILLALAVVFLQIARRLRMPYPSLLALAGGCVAVLPFAPHLGIQPQLALALFVAPAVMDTAFDMPPRELPPSDAVMVDDFILDTEGDAAVLRLLGSGFPAEQAWEIYYLRLRNGWGQALQRLKVCLERLARAPDVTRT